MYTPPRTIGHHSRLYRWQYVRDADRVSGVCAAVQHGDADADGPGAAVRRGRGARAAARRVRRRVPPRRRRRRAARNGHRRRRRAAEPRRGERRGREARAAVRGAGAKRGGPGRADGERAGAGLLQAGEHGLPGRHGVRGEGDAGPAAVHRHARRRQVHLQGVLDVRVPEAGRQFEDEPQGRLRAHGQPVPVVHADVDRRRHGRDHQEILPPPRLPLRPHPGRPRQPRHPERGPRRGHGITGMYLPDQGDGETGQRRAAPMIPSAADALFSYGHGCCVHYFRVVEEDITPKRPPPLEPTAALKAPAPRP